MKKTLLVVWSLMLVFALVGSGWAAEKKAAEKPNATMVDVVTVEALVESVDAAARTVTLKMPNGMQRTVALGPEVRNFDQIKAGDKVKARFIESLAINVAKTKEEPAASGSRTVELAPKGEKPGMIAVDTAEMVASVQKIDYKKRLITLKGPEGNEQTFKVDKSAKRFKNIKKGDNVYIRYTQAMVISVDKPVQ